MGNTQSLPCILDEEFDVLKYYHALRELENRGVDDPVTTKKTRKV